MTRFGIPFLAAGLVGLAALGSVGNAGATTVTARYMIHVPGVHVVYGGREASSPTYYYNLRFRGSGWHPEYGDLSGYTVFISPSPQVAAHRSDETFVSQYYEFGGRGTYHHHAF